MQKYFNYFLNDRGEPIASASVTVKTSAGAVATIYSDNAGTVTANPLTTDSSGLFAFYAANGTYTLSLSKPGHVATVSLGGVLLHDPDDDPTIVSIADAVNSIADLRAAGVPAIDDIMMSVLCHTTPGDGGAGDFYWDAASTDADDNGITILPTGYAGVGRWKRADADLPNAKWFGGDFAQAVAAATGKTLIVNSSVSVSANTTVSSTVELRFERGGKIIPASGVTVTISGPVDAGLWQVFDLSAGGSIAFGEKAPIEWAYPEWWGAVGDASTDSTDGVQAAINAWPRAVRYTGRYLINTTLTTPSAAGSNPSTGKWQGNGGWMLGSPLATTRDDNYTALIWNGANGGTLLEMTDLSGIEFNGITFLGKPTSASVDQAGKLVHFKFTVYATGVSVFRHCGFYNATTGVQMGTLSTDDTCSDMMFEFTSWGSLTNGYLVKNSQSVNHSFYYVHVNSVKSMWWFERGGSVYVRHSNLSACGGSGADEWVIRFQGLTDGSSVAVFDGLRVEQNTQQLLKAETVGSITINSLEEIQNDQNVTQVHLIGPTLKMNDCRLVSNDTTNPFFSVERGPSAERTALLLNNVHFDVTAFTLTDWVKWADTNDFIDLSFKECHFANERKALPWLNSNPMWGPVVQYGTTTDATVTNLSLNGAAINYYNTCPLQTDNTTWIFDVYIVAQNSDLSLEAAFHRRAVIQVAAGTTALVGAVQTIGADQNTPGWSVAVGASNTYTSLLVQVTGAAATTINWKAVLVPVVVA